MVLHRLVFIICYLTAEIYVKVHLCLYLADNIYIKDVEV